MTFLELWESPPAFNILDKIKIGEGIYEVISVDAAEGDSPPNGPAVVLQQPVTRVVVSDREPWWFVGDREFGWFREDGVANYQPQYNSRRRVGVINSVPAELFALFPRRYGDQTETYPTAEAAVEALSRVLVDWARAKAGLTPIQWEVTT